MKVKLKGNKRRYRFVWSNRRKLGRCLWRAAYPAAGDGSVLRSITHISCAARLLCQKIQQSHRRLHMYLRYSDNRSNKYATLRLR